MDCLMPTCKEYVDNIRKAIPLEDLYMQLAEEASELSQACLKMARKIRNTNPTPKDEDAIRNDILEEYTDVRLVATDILGLEPDELIEKYKLYRWSKRLERK